MNPLGLYNHRFRLKEHGVGLGGRSFFIFLFSGIPLLWWVLASLFLIWVSQSVVCIV